MASHVSSDSLATGGHMKICTTYSEWLCELGWLPFRRQNDISHWIKLVRTS